MVIALSSRRSEICSLHTTALEKSAEEVFSVFWPRDEQ